MVTRTAKLAAVAVGLCVVVLGVSAQPSWAEDAFAKITGSVQGIILGDQPNIPAIPGSRDTVQVFSTVFGLGVHEAAVGSTRSNIPVARPLGVVKRFDRASPKLLRAAFTSEPLTVEITWFMNFQNTPRKTVTIKLDGALITDIQASAELQGAQASGFETVTFTYSKLTFSTPILDPATGQVTGTSTICLDVVGNRIC
jgi:type VI secretion system Hcp family effector